LKGIIKGLTLSLERMKNGMPWKPAEGDHLCSQHFTYEEKSDLATSLDFVPSVYLKTVEKRRSLLIQQLVTV